MNRLALILRNSYQAIDKEKVAQVEENISAGEAAPAHNKLKTSPAQSAGSTPPPAGLPSGAPSAGPQEQLAPQQGAMPPAAPPGETQQAGVGEQNPQAIEAPQPTPLVTPLSSSPSRGGKGRKKTGSDREQLVALLKKQAEDGDGWDPLKSLYRKGVSAVRGIDRMGKKVYNYFDRSGGTADATKVNPAELARRRALIDAGARAHQQSARKGNVTVTGGTSITTKKKDKSPARAPAQTQKAKRTSGNVVDDVLGG